MPKPFMKWLAGDFLNDALIWQLAGFEPKTSGLPVHCYDEQMQWVKNSNSLHTVYQLSSRHAKQASDCTPRQYADDDIYVTNL